MKKIENERSEVLSKLNLLFQKNFNDESIALNEKTSSFEIDGWNSIEQISLASSIQEEFNVRIKYEEINKMKSVSDMVDLIVQKM